MFSLNFVCITLLFLEKKSSEIVHLLYDIHIQKVQCFHQRLLYVQKYQISMGYLHPAVKHVHSRSSTSKKVLKHTQCVHARHAGSSGLIYLTLDLKEGVSVPSSTLL